MGTFKRMILVELKKAFTSPAIYVVIALLIVFYMIDTIPLCSDTGVGISYLIYNKEGGIGAVCLLGFCVSVMPFVLQYLNETDNNCIYFYINRSDIFSYSISKIISVCLTTFAAVIISNILYILILLTMGINISDEFFLENYQDGHILLAEGKELLFISLIVLIDALRSVFFAVVSLCLSSFIKNKFLIISLPVVFYFGVGRFLFLYMNVPDWLNISVIYQPLTISIPDDLHSFMMTAAFTSVMMVMFGTAFAIRVRWCVRNGKF